jgi:hypothetical protein
MSDKAPDLIIVDTLARNFLGDESSPRDMGLFVDGLERIRRVIGTAVLVVHHTMKSDPQRERGTEALRAASFAMYKVSNPQARTRQGGGSVNLECDRMKDARVPAPLRVEFKPVELDVDQHGDVYSGSLAMPNFPKGAKKLRQKSAEKNRPRIGRDESAATDYAADYIDQLLRIACGQGLKSNQARDVLKVGKTKAKSVMNRLVKDGFLIQQGEGRATYYVGTAKAEKRIGRDRKRVKK